MTHTLFIIAHTVAGAVAFFTGILALPLTTLRSWRWRWYVVSLVLTIVTVGGAVWVSWGELPTVTRSVYAGLMMLGAYMLYRASRSAQRLRRRDRDWRERYFDGVTFTLISLFDAFVIVAAIDLGAPGWLVGVVAVGGVAGGVWAKRTAAGRILGTAAV